jgi:hypothetical protein
MRFDPDPGGAVHARCGGGVPVETATLRWLEALRRAPLAETLGGPDLPLSARWLLGDFVRHQLGRAPRSRSLLEELNL